MKSKQLVQEKLTFLKSELKIIDKAKSKAEKNSNRDDWNWLNKRSARVESKIGILLWILGE